MFKLITKHSIPETPKEGQETYKAKEAEHMNHQPTNKEERQQGRRECEQSLNQFYSRETSPLILMQRQITNLSSSTSTVKHLSETHISRDSTMKQSKRLNSDLKPGHKKTTNR